jgi:hypothetical protein
MSCSYQHQHVKTPVLTKSRKTLYAKPLKRVALNAVKGVNVAANKQERGNKPFPSFNGFGRYNMRGEPEIQFNRPLKELAEWTGQRQSGKS